MPTWEVISLVILGLMVLITLIRFGLIGLIFNIIGAIFDGDSGGGGGGDSGGFGGGDSGGGGSSSDW